MKLQANTHLALKVVPNELERVVQSMDCSLLDLGDWLLSPGTLHHSRENLIRASCEDFRALPLGQPNC